MSYKAVMVVADASPECQARVQLAAKVARDFDAVLLGVAAVTTTAADLGAMGGAYAVSEALIGVQQDMLEEDLRTAEHHFRTATSPVGREAQWLRANAPPPGVLIEEACRADLIIAGQSGRDGGRGFGDELLLRSGRPVLVAPPGRESLQAQTIMIAWKDTREARRAVADALPFLQRARRVIIASTRDHAEARDDGASIGKISDYLGRHNVAIQIERVAKDEGGVGERLVSAAHAFEADLIVAGAYGHSRMREWVFGGVSEVLLTRASIVTLMSH